MTVTRRTFIRAGLLSTAALPLWDPLSWAAKVETQERRGPPQRIIVIGAGLAGLCAAYHLVEAGHDVLVIEAQRRAGGRVQTLRDFSDNLSAEAGATRIPDHHHFTLKYVKLFGLELDAFTPPGSAVYYLRGRRLVVAPGENPEWPLALTSQERSLGLTGMMDRAYEKLLDDVGDPTSVDWPAERFWRYDHSSLTEFLRGQGLSEDAIHLRRAAFGTSGDAEFPESALRSLSGLALGRPLKTYWRIRGGNDRLPHAFALHLAERVRYGAAVLRLLGDDMPKGTLASVKRQAGLKDMK